MSLPIGVLISGSGTNLQAIINKIEQNVLNAEIKVVISNNPNAYGIERSKKHNIPYEIIDHRLFKSREEHEKKIIEVLKASGVEVVVLAGYMRLLSSVMIKQYANKIINIHPAILPSFKGINAQKQAFDYGVKITGATVHFVDEHLDHGPIIIQSAISIENENDPDAVAQKILKTEHRIYPQAIQWIAEKRVVIEGRKVKIKKAGKPLADISDLMPCVISPPLEEGF